MFGIGAGELIVLLALALIIVGPQKLPEIGRTIGSALGQFKAQTDELKSALNFDTTPIKSTPASGSPTSHFPGFGTGYGEAVSKMNNMGTAAVQEEAPVTLEEIASNDNPSKEI